jgi:uncharacterized membrane-anchored protein
MKHSTLLFLQTILIFLQTVNTAVGVTIHLDPVWCVLIGASIGAFQYYVQNVGNKSEPPAPK